MSPADLSRREPTPEGETEATVPGPVDLARLEALANEATSGPWFRYFSDAQKADHIRSTTGEWVAQFAASEADADFIAAMRNAAPSLFAAVRAVERVRALCDEYRANCDPASVQAQVAESLPGRAGRWCMSEHGVRRYPLRQSSARGEPKPTTTIERTCRKCGASFLGLAAGKTGEAGIWHHMGWWCSVECYGSNPDALDGSDD